MTQIVCVCVCEVVYCAVPHTSRHIITRPKSSIVTQLQSLREISVFHIDTNILTPNDLVPL
jgi:hypothetical protein